MYHCEIPALTFDMLKLYIISINYIIDLITFSAFLRPFFLPIDLLVTIAFFQILTSSILPLNPKSHKLSPKKNLLVSDIVLWATVPLPWSLPFINVQPCCALTYPSSPSAPYSQVSLERKATAIPLALDGQDNRIK